LIGSVLTDKLFLHTKKHQQKCFSELFQLLSKEDIGIERYFQQYKHQKNTNIWVSRYVRAILKT